MGSVGPCCCREGGVVGGVEEDELDVELDEDDADDGDGTDGGDEILGLALIPRLFWMPLLGGRFPTSFSPRAVGHALKSPHG